MFVSPKSQPLTHPSHTNSPKNAHVDTERLCGCGLVDHEVSGSGGDSVVDAPVVL